MNLNIIGLIKVSMLIDVNHISYIFILIHHRKYDKTRAEKAICKRFKTNLKY